MAFWNKNKHDICPNEKDLKTLVTNYLGANSKIKNNSKVTVPEGYFCVLGRRGKVADKFDTGEHFLNYANLPYMCRRFGIDKLKDGKQAEKFPCNIYFVSKELQPGKFKTYRKVEMGTRAYGIYKAHVYGMYSYKVTNPQELLQSLLNEYDYIKTGEAESLIEAWVNDLVVSCLEKNNFVITDVVNNNPIIAESLKKSISKLFDTAGLELCDLKIYKYKLPKQYQAQSDEILAKQLGQEKVVNEENIINNQQKEETQKIFDENTQNIQTNQQENEITKEQSTEDIASRLNKNNSTQENSIKNNKVENIGSIDENVQREYNQHVNQSDYVPFGNFVINIGSIENLQNDDIQKAQKQKPKFVDLNLDNLYADKRLNTKRCLNCGAENNKNSDRCVLCGEKFNEGDF